MRREERRSGIMAGGAALGLMLVGVLLLGMGASVRIGEMSPRTGASPTLDDARPFPAVPEHDRMAMVSRHDIEYGRLE